MKIKINDYVSFNKAVTINEGKKIYNLIIDNINKELIELDFSELNLVTISFLNISIGCLYKNYSSEELNKQIKLINLNQNIKEKILIVKENSKRYYGKSR